MTNFGKTAVNINWLAKTEPDRNKRNGLYTLKTYLTAQAIKKGQVKRLVQSIDNPALMEVKFIGNSRQVHVPINSLNKYL